MKQLIEDTVEKATLWNQRWPNGVILWSGGKDSMAMLHFLRFKMGLKLPVIQWREHKLRERYAYSDRFIKEWGLEVYDYPASRLELASGIDTQTGEIRFDLLKYFQWGTRALILSLGTERPVEGKPYLCAVDDYLGRPTGTFNWKWQSAWIGTKNTDADLIKGQICLKQHVRLAEGSPAQLYPMRDWTDKNIFQYLEDNGVEPDPTRYIKVGDTWENNPDKSLNADFYPTCVNCVDRHQGKQVYCPKLKCEITNISDKVPYGDLEFDDLGFRKTWLDDGGKELNDKRHVVG